MALGASLLQRVLLVVAPVASLAVAAFTASLLLGSLLLQLVLGADFSSARTVMAVGGTFLCLSIGPSTALIYYLLGLLSRAPVPVVARAAIWLLAEDARGQVQRRVNNARSVVAPVASVLQGVVLMFAPITAIAVAVNTVSALVITVILQLVGGGDYSSMQMKIAFGGGLYCLCIGPIAALVYFLLGLLWRVPAARRLLIASSQAQQHQVTEAHAAAS